MRSVKDECLSKLILFGEAALRRSLASYLDHYHGERSHQGEEKCDPLYAFGKERDFRRAHPVPGTAGRAPQVLPPEGGMKSDTPDGEKEFETPGLFIFGALSLIMAILKLVNWNSSLAKPSRKGDKFFDHMPNVTAGINKKDKDIEPCLPVNPGTV